MNINEGKERNALAELAEALNANASYLNSEGLDCARDNVLLASRIIAELAKVKPVYNVYTNEPCWPTAGQACDALMACRAIAEEGAKNG